MADSQFCLEWDSHNKNICNGLSSLQQNGEFVDMTLAADGHHVKVHQMVMALASPYIKELISTANCPHPVIFLNKVSYKTLCSILEYIYTGQALVAVDDISDLIIAAKELHIKGLEDVKAVGGTPSVTEVETDFDEMPKEVPEIQIKLQRPDTSTPQFSALNTLKRKLESNKLSSMPIRKRVLLNKSATENSDMPVLQTDGKDKEVGYDDPLDVDDRDDYDDDGDQDTTVAVSKPSADNPQMSVQYTVSNQGSLQLILNRFLYFLYYQYRDKSRQWRCVDNRNNKCMASVFTKDNIVLRRVGAHNHTFHDKNILKKVRAGSVYSALQEAEAKSTRNCRGRGQKPRKSDAAEQSDNQDSRETEVTQ
ncbi:longitudinals lacking protein, isoforms H/M/V-like isoform X2 [Cydia strobilella]|uniref:longitudinals lacking protein, isoforms H/M/V-like isoform X2 n=1 Tax=Cydia strobilella TaxID=1100964 RepID=UPI003006101B